MSHQDYLATVRKPLEEIDQLRNLEDKIASFSVQDSKLQDDVRTATGLYLAEKLQQLREQYAPIVTGKPELI